MTLALKILQAIQSLIQKRLVDIGLTWPTRSFTLMILLIQPLLVAYHAGLVYKILTYLITFAQKWFRSSMLFTKSQSIESNAFWISNDRIAPKIF